MGSNFRGVKFLCISIYFSLEIFLGIQFHWCCILCMQNLETTQSSSVIIGHHIYVQGSMGTHTRPDFAVCMGNQQQV